MRFLSTSDSVSLPGSTQYEICLCLFMIGRSSFILVTCQNRWLFIIWLIIGLLCKRFYSLLVFFLHTTPFLFPPYNPLNSFLFHSSIVPFSLISRFHDSHAYITVDLITITYILSLAFLDTFLISLLHLEFLDFLFFNYFFLYFYLFLSVICYFYSEKIKSHYSFQAVSSWVDYNI